MRTKSGDMIKINQTNWRKTTCAAIALIGLLGAPLPALAETAQNDRNNMTQTYVFTADGAVKKALPLGVIPVRTAEPWNETAGYGFTSQKNGNEQAFSVRVPEGDYRVRIELDSGNRAS
ncbi:MAG: hypothetical protein AAGC58_13535, partial [Asticcacaulis sp.]